MSTKQLPEKWMHLTACPAVGYVLVPTGANANNYIGIDRGSGCTKIICIYKYNTDTDKWSKIDVVNNIQTVPYCSAALNVHKQILFVVCDNQLTQIQLNNNHINNYDHDAAVQRPLSAKSIILNDSLFVIGGWSNKSILKWNSESKAFSQFTDMHTKTGMFGMVNNNNKNNLLIFGGYDCDNRRCDHILEFNFNKKQCNKLSVSLPKKMISTCCTMAINNKYVILFGGC
eukprot:494418_1